jgi:hypothetical protein
LPQVSVHLIAFGLLVGAKIVTPFGQGVMVIETIECRFTVERLGLLVIGGD